MLIPHLILRDREDRSWTFRLLDRLAAPELADAEREAIAGSLSCLEDPRATAPLLALLEDRGRPEGVREAAAGVLRGAGNSPPGPTLRAWWGQDDAVLQRHALLSMGRAEADLVASVLAEPAHPRHLQAILTAELGFDEPRFQAPRLSALEHRDPRVRRAAAGALVWDEPCAAEEPLLRCAADVDAGVAMAAVQTLEHYPTRRVMAGLSALVLDPRPAVAAEAVEALENLRHHALMALIHAGSAERAALCAWMDPVWSILEFTSEDLVPPPAPSPPLPSAPDGRLPAADLIALFSDPDGLWADRKALVFTLDPAAFSARERAILTPFLVSHGDPWVRERAAHWLAAWGDHATLQQLARDDTAFEVRKSAMFALGLTPVVPAVAALAWDHLHAPGTSSTHAYETLRTYVAHAPRDEAIPRLLDLAQTDARETVRAHAVRELCTLEARSAIARLLPLLEAPPAITWEVHLALLDAVSRLDLPLPMLDSLREADNLDVQRALAPFDPEER
ncbi:MAG: HEAT repeat domain-containing protein [Byssovorax sp.]